MPKILNHLECLYNLNSVRFWFEIDGYDFPMDYEKTPEDYVKETFPFLNADDKDKVVEIYKEYILDQYKPEDEDGV